MTVMGIIGLVVYYYTTFEDLRSEYNIALTNLENLTEQVNQTRNELSAKKARVDELYDKVMELQQEKNLSDKRVDSMSGIYLQEKDRAANLETNLNSTQNEKERYEQLYNKYYDENRANERRYNEANSQLTSERNKVTKMKADAQDISDQVLTIETRIASIYTYLAYIEQRAGDIRDAENVSNIIENDADDIKDDATTIDGTVTDIADNNLKTIKEKVQDIKGA